MSNIFGGLRKSRVRQSSVSGQDLSERSVPYDMTIASRSPIAVSTLSPQNRGISAPNTNPSLTTSGTEFNKFTTLRQYSDESPTRTSTSTADSSTLFDESSGPIPSPNVIPIPHPQTARLRRNDFGQFSPPQGSPRSARPSSGMTVKSDTSRNSKATTSPDSSHSPLSFHLHHRQSSESFHFPRPSDEEVETLFEKVKQMCGDPKGLDKFTVDQKWELVKNGEQIRWRESRMAEQSRRQQDTGQPLQPQSPEWFIHKLMNRTITPKQVSDLMVCLRSKDVSWFQQFIALRGTSVLALTLQNLSRNGSSRSDTNKDLEYEVTKCVRHILNSGGASDVLNHPSIVTQIASSLNSPHFGTRKNILDSLIFLTHWKDGATRDLVLCGIL